MARPRHQKSVQDRARGEALEGAERLAFPVLAGSEEVYAGKAPLPENRMDNIRTNRPLVRQEGSTEAIRQSVPNSWEKGCYQVYRVGYAEVSEQDGFLTKGGGLCPSLFVYVIHGRCVVCEH